MELGFKGKRVLVTGAGAGIGRALCVKLVELGAEVIGMSRTTKNLESLKAQCPSIHTLCVDLSDWEATRKATSSVLPIHCLVNNAAVACLEPFLQISPYAFDLSFNVNVKSVLNVSQIVAKDMVERGEGGSIVNLSSQTSQAALCDHTVYAGTKAALDSFTRTMALELGPHQIRINSINPTVVLTAMGRLGWSDPSKADPMKAKIPLGRFAEVEEVVEPILFLLSDASTMVTGTTLPIDGGFLAC